MSDEIDELREALEQTRKARRVWEGVADKYQDQRDGALARAALAEAVVVKLWSELSEEQKQAITAGQPWLTQLCRRLIVELGPPRRRVH